MNEDAIPVIKQPRKTRRKRMGITPKEVRAAIDVLNSNLTPQVKYSSDPLEMANQAIVYLRTAMFQALEILERKK